MSKIDKNAGEDCGQWSRRASKILNVRAVCDLPRHVWEQNTKKKSALNEENESKLKKNKKRCQWSSKNNAIPNGGTCFIIKLYPLSCWTRENDGRETPGKVTLWTLDARKCGLETPNAIMKTDARRLKNFSMDAGRLQKYPPGRQTPNLFPPPKLTFIAYSRFHCVYGPWAVMHFYIFSFTITTQTHT